MRKPSPTSNLAALYPDLARQWHPTKNGDLRPEGVGAKSNKKVWWQCPVNPAHEWPAVIATRLTSGCKLCYEEAHLKYWITGADGEKRPETLSDRPTLFSELVAEGEEREKLGACYVGEVRKLTWQCAKCHQQWQNQLRKRAIEGQDCKCHRGHTTYEGNSLLALHPKIAAQWDFEMNALDAKLVNGPGSVSPGKHYKAWWKCLHGHSWEAEIKQRVSYGTECPKCNPKVSKEELRFGCEILAVFGLNVLRSKKVHGKEADLQIPSLNLIVEVDGFPWHSPSHFPIALERDQKKNTLFKSKGYSVLRIREVRLPPIDNCVTVHFKNGPDQLIACKALVAAIAEIPGMTDDLLQRAQAYQGSSDYLADAEYQQLAATLSIPATGESLAERFPLLAAEWSTKNLPLTPELINPGSHDRVWWTCANGHNWYATIKSRTTLNTGCSKCSGRVASKGNSLAECFPEVAAQWNYARNGDKRPEGETPKNSKIFWWVCERGHSWPASINNRTRGKNGCPYCGHKLPSAEWNLAAVHPEVAKFFDLEKNAPLRAQDVMPNGREPFWWRCQHGHEWNWTADRQSRYGSRCRQCEKDKIGQHRDV